MNTNYTTNGSPFYYRVLLQQDSGVQAQLEAPWVVTLPRPSEGPLVTVLSSETTRKSAGMYILAGADWRFVLPYTEVAEGVRLGIDISLYFDVEQPISVDPSASIWRNGLPFSGTQVEPGAGYVWAVLEPHVRDLGDVTSVNGVSPDASGNVQIGIGNIPNLQSELDTKLTQVVSVNTDGLSLVSDSGTTDTIAKLLGVAAYDGLTVTPDSVRKTVQVRGVPATSATLGVMKVGLGLSVASDGTVSANPYTLPIATATVLGGVKQGANITIAIDGTISTTAAPYTLPPATAATLGGVKIGSGINVAADGTISSGISQGVTSVVAVGTGVSWVADDGSTNSQAKIKTLAVGSHLTLTLPGDGNTLNLDAVVPVQSVSGQTGAVVIQTQDNNGATGSSLIADGGSTTGIVKLRTLVPGTGITITPDSNGNLEFASSGGYTLPAATDTVLGGVKIGANVSVAVDGTISVAAPYVLPAATTSTLGGVIVGPNLSVSSGTIDAPIATALALGVVKPGSGLSIAADGTLSVTAAGGVTSVNGKTGAVSVTGTGNVTVDNSGASIVIGSTGVSEAPIDGNLYGRKNQAWAQIPDVTQALIAVNSAGSVGSTSLVFNSSTNNAAELKGVIAGTGITITDDTMGNLTFTASANGFVTSVNSQTPDAGGAVTLTAANVGALPLSGGMMTGPINMNSQAISNLPTPVNAGDAIPYSLITGMTIDNGTYA